MWEKSFRYSVFAALYQVLFWNETTGSEEFNLDVILENLKDEEKPDKDKLTLVIARFFDKKAEYTDTLKTYLKDWDKTFAVVKACLYTYILEIEELSSTDPQPALDTIITKYIRLSEDHIGGQNVALVHAILSKVQAEYLKDTTQQ